MKFTPEISLKNQEKKANKYFLKSSKLIILKQNHMTDLSIMISFTSFQAYYVHLGPAAVEKTSDADILFFTYLSSISYCTRNHLLN